MAAAAAPAYALPPIAMLAVDYAHESATGDKPSVVTGAAAIYCLYSNTNTLLTLDALAQVIHI